MSAVIRWEGFVSANLDGRWKTWPIRFLELRRVSWDFAERIYFEPGLNSWFSKSIRSVCVLINPNFPHSNYIGVCLSIYTKRYKRHFFRKKSQITPKQLNLEGMFIEVVLQFNKEPRNAITLQTGVVWSCHYFHWIGVIAPIFDGVKFENFVINVSPSKCKWKWSWDTLYKTILL